MATCYACNSVLTENNKSKEHIFLNAAGGRLRSSKLLCLTCNGTFGRTCDAELAKQLNIWANLLNIQFQRGAPNNISSHQIATKHGERDIYVEPGGKAVLVASVDKTEIHENSIDLLIEARDEKQIRHRLESYKKKYPLSSFDVEKSLQEKSKRFTFTQRSDVQISIGGKHEFRSICKTAINLFLFKDGCKEYIKHLIPYLKGEKELNAVWFYYPDHQIIDYGKSCDVFHSIIIVGDNQNKTLYAYLEYFNAYKFMMAW